MGMPRMIVRLPAPYQAVQRAGAAIRPPLRRCTLSDRLRSGAVEAPRGSATMVLSHHTRQHTLSATRSPIPNLQSSPNRSRVPAAVPQSPQRLGKGVVVARSTPRVDGPVLVNLPGSASGIAVGSPAWFAWLEAPPPLPLPACRADSPHARSAAGGVVGIGRPTASAKACCIAPIWASPPI